MSATHQPYLLLPNGEKFPLTGNTSIGRADECSIFLDGTEVSRLHTHIYKMGDHFQVADSQSRNGTYVNKQRIKGPVSLQSGDQIGVGGHLLTFFDEQTPVPKRAPMVPGHEKRTMDLMHKMLTWLLLLDIKDSTQIALQCGEEGYGSLFSGWFSACQEIIERHGGIVNKSTGDGLLAYWKDSEGICGEEVAKALESLRTLQSANPPFRLVVHYGLVAIGGGAGLGEEPLSGPEVHLIFRAEKDLSQTSSDFAATEAGAWGLERWMRRFDLGLFSPKGFGGHYQLYHLESRQPGGEDPRNIS